MGRKRSRSVVMFASVKPKPSKAFLDRITGFELASKLLVAPEDVVEIVASKEARGPAPRRRASIRPAAIPTPRVPKHINHGRCRGSTLWCGAGSRCLGRRADGVAEGRVHEERREKHLVRSVRATFKVFQPTTRVVRVDGIEGKLAREQDPLRALVNHAAVGRVAHSSTVAVQTSVKIEKGKYALIKRCPINVRATLSNQTPTFHVASCSVHPKTSLPNGKPSKDPRKTPSLTSDPSFPTISLARRPT